MNTGRSFLVDRRGSRTHAILALTTAAVVICLLGAPVARSTGGDTYAVTDIGDLSQNCAGNPLVKFGPPMGAGATALNNAGQVAGWVRYYCPDDGTFWGFRWSNGTLTLLESPVPANGWDSAAVAINDSGVAVGWSSLLGVGGRTATEWDGSTATDIGTLAYGGPCPQIDFPDCANDSVRSFATNVNNHGEVVGLSSLTPGSPATTPFLYRDGVLYNNADGSLGGPQRTIGTNAWGQTVSGQTVGIGAYVFAAGDPTVTRDGVVTHLADVVPPDSGLTLIDAADINDRGQIVGTAATTDCVTGFGCSPALHPYLLTDHTPPSCVLSASGTNASGQNYVTFTIQDDLSGLKDLATTHLTNVRLDTPQWNAGTPRPVVVTATQVSQSPGTLVALQATDIGGNSSGCSAAAPLLSPHVSGTLGRGGWYTGDVTVTWNVSDPQSAIASTSGCTSTTVTADTAGTTYTCTAKNEEGLATTASVTVKRDATPPRLSIPASITVAATGPNGAKVTYAASATDNLDPSPRLACSRNSGANFPVGTTTVTCTATDAAGNSTSGRFSVRVTAGK